jgi:filamentous hemagglutinin
MDYMTLLNLQGRSYEAGVFLAYEPTSQWKVITGSVALPAAGGALIKGVSKLVGAGLLDVTPNLRTVVLTESQARKLTGANRGLIYVTETPRGGSAAQQFQAGTAGSFSDIATGKTVVPALRYDNPNPGGVNYIKFDGVEMAPDGSAVLLLDAKTKLPLWSQAAQDSVRATLKRVRKALEQNPRYRVIYEFPNEAAKNQASKFITSRGYDDIISVRTRAP